MKFNYLKIKDVCDFVGGSQPPKSQFIYVSKPGYVRLIQTRDYKTDAFPTYIPISSTKKFCDEFDIMIGRYGPPIFQICRGLKGAYNVALLKVIPKEGVSRDFLYYFLKQDSVFQYVDKLSARTGGQTGVDLVSLKEYPVRIPEEIECQEKLVTILSVIDKKIALNNRINTELEAMAKTLYDYWFVQFDFPDANGKPYKTSGGKMVYNATLKREIPAGWSISNLGDIAELYQPKTISGKHLVDNGKYLVYGANGIVGRFDEYNHKKSMVTITCRGNTCGNINITRPYSWITGNAMVVKPNHDYLSSYYIYNLLLTSEIDKVITGSAQPQITRANLAPLKVVNPAVDVLQRFSIIADGLFKKQISMLDENEKLSNLRDWLLPLLMNGQVTVK